MIQPEKQTDDQILENEIPGLCPFTNHSPSQSLSKLKLDAQLCHGDWRVFRD
jgi:hypothetical protein